MSRDPELPPERELADHPEPSPERELADDEEWDDEPEEGERRPPLSRRTVLALAGGALVLALVLVPLAVLTVPAVSDAVLLPKASADLVLDRSDLPPGFTTMLDQPKAIDLGLDDSQLGLVRKAQLVAFGFGGGWLRTFERAAETGLVQVTAGVSVYRGTDGARLEWARTIAELGGAPQWKRFSLGADVGDEFVAYEQAIAGAHATLVYYRYANVLAQVSLTYRGSADEAFRGAAKAARDLAKAQTDRERFARFKP